MAKKINDEDYTPRTVKIDPDFLGELTSENKKMNKVREKMIQRKLNSSEELIELAKEGLAARKRLREIS